MKKTIATFGILLISLTIFTSCGESQIEKDAKEVAEQLCKSKYEKVSNPNEGTQLTLKSLRLLQEKQKKYTSKSDNKKFMEAYRKAVDECKKRNE